MALNSRSLEEWMPWPYDERYEVSNRGRVRSWAVTGRKTRGNRSKLLTPYLTGDAKCQYPTVSINNRNIKVHRMVLESFCGPVLAGMQVNHIDGNKLNSAVLNLEYVTPSQNVKHAFDTGLAEPRRGESNNKAKLTTEDVIAIRRSKATGVALARRYGVSPAAISSVRRRRHWRHVGG